MLLADCSSFCLLSALVSNLRFAAERLLRQPEATQQLRGKRWRAERRPVTNGSVCLFVSQGEAGEVGGRGNQGQKVKASTGLSL